MSNNAPLIASWGEALQHYGSLTKIYLAVLDQDPRLDQSWAYQYVDHRTLALFGIGRALDSINETLLRQ